MVFPGCQDQGCKKREPIRFSDPLSQKNKKDWFPELLPLTNGKGLIDRFVELKNLNHTIG